MPDGLTGCEVASKLRSLKPELKVVLSSGYGAQVIESDSLAQQDVEFLPKPYNAQVTLSTVRAAPDSAP